MNFKRKAAAVFAAVGMTAATTVGVLAVTAGPAAAGGCYGQPLQRISTDVTFHREGRYAFWRSNAFMVTPGSPCRDINMRGSWNTGWGRSECIQYRVRFAQYMAAATEWRTVCSGWNVVFYNADEGDGFYVESKAPASVRVRT